MHRLPGTVQLARLNSPPAPRPAAALEEAQAEVRRIEGEIRGTKAKMAELKTALYAKFGNQASSLALLCSLLCLLCLAALPGLFAWRHGCGARSRLTGWHGERALAAS